MYVNTGLHMCMCAQSCQTLCDPLDCRPTRLLCPSPGKNTGVGCYFLLQMLFPDPGTESEFPASPALAGGFFISAPYGKPRFTYTNYIYFSLWKSLIIEKSQYKFSEFTKSYGLQYHISAEKQFDLLAGEQGVNAKIYTETTIGQYPS